MWVGRPIAGVLLVAEDGSMLPEALRRIRVLVVDDDDRFAMAVMALLDADPRLEVVGRAENGNQAIRLVTELKPDVVTMDLEMPVTDGLEATRALMSRPFKVPIIIVSGSRSSDMLSAAVAAGAAFDLKPIPRGWHCSAIGDYSALAKLGQCTTTKGGIFEWLPQRKK